MLGRPISIRVEDVESSHYIRGVWGVHPQKSLKICPLNGAFGAISEQNRGTLVTNGGHFAQIRVALWCKWGHIAQIWRAFCPKSGAFCHSWGGGMAPLAPLPQLDQPLPGVLLVLLQMVSNISKGRALIFPYYTLNKKSLNE